MYLSIIGFLMLFLIIYLLFKEKSTPMIVFITVPVIAAFAAGFSVEEVTKFITKGIGTVSSMSILFIFSVTFFGVMSDAGMFDFLVSKLVHKAGTNVILIAAITAIVAIFAHLDGATVTTVLVTVPAMLPLYRKLNIRPHLLLLVTGCGMGVMNLLPWGGPVARAAAVIGMDANELWHILIPLQILGMVGTVALAIIMIIKEVKFHGAGVVQTHISFTEATEEVSNEQVEKLKRPKLVLFNFILTAAVLGVLLIDKFPTYFVFMWGCAIALIVNYPNLKEQKARIKAHAPAALDVSAVMLAAGIMVGILGQSGMLEAMAIPLLKIIPPAIAKYLHILMGAIALPLGTMLGTDSYFYGLLPLCIEIGENYGITSLNMAIAMLVGKNLSLLVSPLVPATYLGIGLAGIELKEHVKYSIPPLWIVSIIMLIFAILIGLVTL